MICIVLAAGYATRLYPLTENFPKPLLPVADRPIVDWVLDSVDCDRTVVISNHKFVEHFNDWAKGKKNITILDDGSTDNDHRLGAVRDILFAVDSLGIDEDALVVAGDNVIDFSLADFTRFAKDRGTSCVMCHEENELAKQRKTAIITLDAADRITSYEEKPAEPKGNLAVPPFYYYLAKDLRRIPEALAEGCSADAPGSFAAWLSGKTEMHAWRMNGRRYDIGDAESYRAVRQIFEG